MTRGRAVQVGSASALFERPQHRFVGHFIGSPGMNFLPVCWAGQGIDVAGRVLPMARNPLQGEGSFALGVRPEYVALAAPEAAGAVPATVTQAQDIGTYWLLGARIGSGDSEQTIRARLSPDQRIPRVGDAVWLSLVGAHTCYYRDDVLIDSSVEVAA
jgi:glycerol transport system ATP-binding protein